MEYKTTNILSDIKDENKGLQNVDWKPDDHILLMKGKNLQQDIINHLKIHTSNVKVHFCPMVLNIQKGTALF
jgi:hypothetical protein